MKSTHTLATMAVSQAAFMEIHANLLGAGYDHAIHKQGDGTDLLDMTGICLVPNADDGIAHAEHLTSSSDQPVPLALMGTVAGRDWLLQEAVRVIQAAQDLGFVLTIDLAPRRPLSMGNYEMMAMVRPARGPRGDYEPQTPPGFNPDTYDWSKAAADSKPIAPAHSYLTSHAIGGDQDGLAHPPWTDVVGWAWVNERNGLTVSTNEPPAYVQPHQKMWLVLRPEAKVALQAKTAALQHALDVADAAKERIKELEAEVFALRALGDNRPPTATPRDTSAMP